MNSRPASEQGSPLRQLFPWLAVCWLALFWFLFFTTTLPNASNSERTIDRLDLFWLLLDIFGSLLTPDRSADPDAGWSRLGERIDVLAVASAIVFSAWALGRLLLRGLGLMKQLSTAERLAISGGLGLSAYSLLTLGLGLAGLLSVVWFAIPMVAIVILEATLSWRSRQPISAAAEPAAPRWLKNGVIVICIPFVWCMLLGSVLPPTDFDVKEYHLGGPKEYFLAGRVQFLPHNVYTSFPFLTEMLALAGMVLRGDWERGAYAGQAVLMVFAPLTAVGVYCAARRLAGDTAGWLGALAYLTTPWTYRISIIAYTEGALCCYVVLSLLAFQLWQAATQQTSAEPAPARQCRWRQLLMLGFLAGSAVATKYPGMVLVAIPFAAAVAVSAWRPFPHRWQHSLVCVLVYGVGVIAAFGPWMAKNLVETGNPVYPLLYGVFGGVDWSEALHQKWRAAHPAKLFSGSWDDFAGVIYKNDWQSPLLFGLAPLAFLHPRRRGILAVAAYAAVLLAGWALLTHRIDRFWVPMNSIMAVLAGCGLAVLLGIENRLPALPASARSKRPQGSAQSEPEATSPSVWPGPVRGLGAGLVAVAILYNFGFITTPLCGYNAYLTSYAAAQEQTQTQSVKIVDWLQLPPGSKVLFVGEAELFNARFPYAYCTVFDNNLLENWTAVPAGPGQWNWKSADEIRQRLDQEGITHLFVNWNEILRYRTTYGYTDFVSPERLQQLVEMGILLPVPLPESLAFRPWDGVDAGWQREIERWAPALKSARQGQSRMLQYACYRVNTQPQQNSPVRREQAN